METKKKEEVIVELPATNENGLFTADTVFTKEQFAQMLKNAGMDARSANGQASIFYKGSSPDVKIESRSGKEIVEKYLASKSKARADILALFDGITDADIKEPIRGKKLADWVDAIKLAFLTDEELSNSYKVGEDAGKSMVERVAPAQKTKISKLLNKKKEELSDDDLKGQCLSLTSKYGLPALLGIEYRNAQP